MSAVLSRHMGAFTPAHRETNGNSWSDLMRIGKWAGEPLTVFKRRFRAVVIAAAIAVSFASPSTLHAQDLPQTISPLQMEPDRNGVNLATGKMSPSPIILSVPGSSRLKFDRVQNAAPYIKGVEHQDFDTGPGKWGEWTFHTAEGVSESFRCAWEEVVGGAIEKQCYSITNSGSTLKFNGQEYRKAGSGEVYTIDKVHVFTWPAPSDPDRRLIRQFYASRIDYPDGELKLKSRIRFGMS